MLTNVENPTSYPKISITEFNSLVRCTQQHDYLYKQKLRKVATSSYLTKGSYLHALMETYLRDPKSFSLSEASARAKARIAEERDSLVLEDDATSVDALFSTWLKSVPDWEVLAVEEEFYADIGLRDMNGDTVLFHGFIDAVVREDDRVVLLEHKTASRAWSEAQLQQNYQGPLYVRAFETLLGTRVDEVRFNFFYPKSIAARSLYPDDRHKDSLVRELQAAVYLRDTGSVVRSPHWSCSSCPMQPYCILETQGMDASGLIGVTYYVDDDEVDGGEE